LYEKARRRGLGSVDGLDACVAFSPDRCHLDDATIRVNCHRGDNTAIWEKEFVEGRVSVDEQLLTLAGNMLKLWHESLEIARREREQESVARPIR
jgi:hypothetical protein